MATKKGTNRLPERIYVYEDTDGEDTFLCAYYDIDSLPEDEKGTLVGTYEKVSEGELLLEKRLS